MALTLRLEDKELEMLERIKHQLGVATASAAIKQLIANYESTQERLAGLLKGYAQERQQAAELKQHVSEYFASQEAIFKLVGHVPNAQTLAALNAPDHEHTTYHSFADFMAEVDNEDA